MMALGAGVEKVFVYREKGSTPSLHAAEGLLRDDGSLKPAWFTYATLIRSLDGMTGGRRLCRTRTPTCASTRWQMQNGKTVLSAWAVDGTGLLALDLGKCTVTDSFGARTSPVVSRDHPLPLSIFPVYVSDIADAGAVGRLSEQP